MYNPASLAAGGDDFRGRQARHQHLPQHIYLYTYTYIYTYTYTYIICLHIYTGH